MDLRTREVDEDADAAPFIGGDLADAVKTFETVVDRPVGQPDPGDVHPRTNHLPERPLVLGRGPDGGDDLRTAMHAGMLVQHGVSTLLLRVVGRRSVEAGP